MNRHLRLAAALLCLAFTLAGCLPDKLATPAEEATAQRWIGELRARHFDAITAAMDPSLHIDDLPGLLARMADAIPPGTPTSVTLVGDSHVMSASTSTATSKVVNLTYEYGFAGQWVLSNVAIKSTDGVDTIAGISAYRIPRSLEEQHRFGFADKPLACYVVLALAILMPLISVFALVVCACTKLRGRKWPWIVFILVGFGQVVVDWATGAWDFHIVYFQLLSAGATASAYGPWIISAAVPVGALVFLARRRELMAPSAVPEPAPAAA